MFFSHQHIASTYGYRMFDAKTIDDLNIEQYNVLVEYQNYKASESERQGSRNTTRIETVPGLPGVDYGED